MDKKRTNKRIGDILLAAGVISQEQLEIALKKQAETHKRLGELMIELGLVTEDQFHESLASQLGIKRIKLEEMYIDSEVARSIPREVAQRHTLIPILEQNRRLTVAMSDPLNIYAIDDVQFLTQRQVDPVIASSASIKQAIAVYYSQQTTDKAIEDLKREYNELAEAKNEQQLDEIQNAPAVRLTNAIITQAVTIRASDIHIEPFEAQIIVRYRVDGALQEGLKIPPNLYSAVSTRIKIMAGMNIAEKRVPQDGRIEMEHAGRRYDFRVSSLPTVFGEKIVIRILDRGGSIFKRSAMNFSDDENEKIDRIIRMPYGLVLVTGPTGSGKTSTLYSFLNELNKPDRNVITVEDPVEYMLEGINQVQVNSKAGLTFASGLRSILRQDPDIIMVGEIRDEETAEIAVRSAITGHLVLSTLHTNDAPGAVTRLVDMGVQPYLVADALIAVMAQRLVRRLCPSCKKLYTTDEYEMHVLGLDEPAEIFRAVGCPACNNTGYKGRLAIHEVMMIDNAIKLLIEKEGNTEQIRSQARLNGMVDLYESCREVVLRGVTTTQELVKTVYARI
jgi:type IV pilus assembly protein PilB